MPHRARKRGKRSSACRHARPRTATAASEGPRESSRPGVGRHSTIRTPGQPGGSIGRARSSSGSGSIGPQASSAGGAASCPGPPGSSSLGETSSASTGSGGVPGSDGGEGGAPSAHPSTSAARSAARAALELAVEGARHARSSGPGEDRRNVMGRGTRRPRRTDGAAPVARRRERGEATLRPSGRSTSTRLRAYALCRPRVGKAGGVVRSAERTRRRSAAGEPGLLGSGLGGAGGRGLVGERGRDGERPERQAHLVVVETGARRAPVLRRQLEHPGLGPDG